MVVRSEPGLTVAIPGEITPGTEMQRGFINDNVLHTPEYGDIHYSSYIPESYKQKGIGDESRPLPLQNTFLFTTTLFRKRSICMDIPAAAKQALS